jgi:hypothetical protein
MCKLVDLTGKTYGNWKIISRGENIGKIVGWLCICKCGTKRTLRSQEINSGNARKDCGCSLSWNGKRFGKLIVINKIGELGNHTSKHLCLCDCGNKKTVFGSNLQTGCTKSCGCIVTEKGKKRGSNLVLGVYQRHAKDMNREFLLKENEFINLIENNCFYCNSKPSNNYYKKNINGTELNYFYNGIDRVNNSKGYTIENCVTCCKICNLMKREMSFEEWINHIKLILNNVKINQPNG